MLTNTELYNIKNFGEFSSGYKRIIRFRLKKRCRKALQDLCLILLYSNNLKLNPEELFSLEDLVLFIDAFEKLSVSIYDNKKRVI